MLKVRILKWIGFLSLLYVAYFAACGIIPPLFHKEADMEKIFPEKDMQEIQERVLCIDDNQAALIWRLRVIEGAREELVLSTYDFRADNSGLDIMSALYHTAERGVDVKIMVDGIPGTFCLCGNRVFQALVSHPNVQVQFYNPIHFLLPYKMNYRMHDKYLIADDSVYILGGRNTNDLFLGSYSDKYNVDRDILVWSEAGGGSVTQLKEYFGEVWNQPCNKLLVYHNGKYEKELVELQEHYNDLENVYPEAYRAFDWYGETLKVNSVLLLSNPTEPENKEPQVWEQLCQIMEQGEQIVIETPYVICNGGMYGELTELCGDGRQIQMIVNAPEGGANPFGCADYMNEKENILNTGSEVFELSNGQSLHTKTILVDDHISIVGSYNLDIRSTYIDTELMLVIDSPELNHMLRENAALEMDMSRHVMPDGTQKYGADFQIVDVPLIRRISSGVLRIALVPFRHLL